MNLKLFLLKYSSIYFTSILWWNDTFRKYQVHESKLCTNKSLSASVECLLFIRVQSFCHYDLSSFYGPKQFVCFHYWYLSKDNYFHDMI